MGHIFISYSNADKDFALRLVHDLEQYYQVWIDKTQLSGGLEWEQMIDKALSDCGLFAVVVSQDSNKSEWVARETIRAEQLGKYRIPILLSGELPLRLLNVHYVDFQGEYDGGFRDLLEVLKKQLEPEDHRHEDANRLIGEGVRAYLIKDYPKANSLIGQALILDSGIAESLEDFWQTIRQEQQTNWAGEYLSKIKIKETASLLEKHIYSEQAGEHIDYYQWSVELIASNDILDRIDYVRYKLHETFANPLQIVRARDDNFRLGGQAWGTFDILIDVYFKDGTVGNGSYELQFENRQAPIHIEGGG
jgi:hypothetical protein